MCAGSVPDTRSHDVAWQHGDQTRTLDPDVCPFVLKPGKHNKGKSVRDQRGTREGTERGTWKEPGRKQRQEGTWEGSLSGYLSVLVTNSRDGRMRRTVWKTGFQRTVGLSQIGFKCVLTQEKSADVRVVRTEYVLEQHRRVSAAISLSKKHFALSLPGWKSKQVHLHAPLDTQCSILITQHKVEIWKYNTASTLTLMRLWHDGHI